MVGAMTFGQPPSAPLCSGWSWPLLELNRIALVDNRKNLVSWWIAACLKKLPKQCVLVSFADPNQMHIGFVYQASNWIYTGLSAATPKHLIDGRFKHDKWVASAKREGRQVVSIPQKPKHRYFYPLATSKAEKKKMLQYISERFGVSPYPKGDIVYYNMEEERERKRNLETPEGFSLI